MNRKELVAKFPGSRLQVTDGAFPDTTDYALVLDQPGWTSEVKVTCGKTRVQTQEGYESQVLTDLAERVNHGQGNPFFKVPAEDCTVYQVKRTKTKKGDPKTFVIASKCIAGEVRLIHTLTLTEGGKPTCPCFQNRFSDDNECEHTLKAKPLFAKEDGFITKDPLT